MRSAGRARRASSARPSRLRTVSLAFGAEAIVLAALDGEWSEGAVAERIAGAVAVNADLARRLARFVLGSLPTADERALRSLVAATLLGPGDPAGAVDEDLTDDVGGDLDEGDDIDLGEDGELSEQEKLADDLRAAHQTSVRFRTPFVRRVRLPALACADPPAFAEAVPRVADLSALASLLDVSVERLVWLADPSRLARHSTDAGRWHYTYRWVRKASGGARLVEAPREQLKGAQRRLYERVLSRVRAHPAAHGFVRGRSVRTFAAPHAGERVVLRVDLEDFFASVGDPRVRGIFETLGMPGPVARVAAALACHRTPRSVLRDAEAGRVERRSLARLAQPHLPQGAPSSPLLASLAAFGLDQRLSALAGRFDANYTRYADDLAFSGGGALMSRAAVLLRAVTEIALDEGFCVRASKTRVMPSATRQVLGGLVVNRWPDVSRGDYDSLRARMHALACGRGVPDGAGERERLVAELRGHVSWASARPHRARKLARLLERAERALMTATAPSW